MADEEQMLRDHRATWTGFCRVIAWTVVAIAIVLLLMRCALV
ncbi:MAG TPA: aa3-type cytochrome c oxidase subunit IV [Kiloniellaceae bacterium]|nr:aa3-type cytochrome c oxidase subunit IV [Kiloniellaceae bacterium]